MILVLVLVGSASCTSDPSDREGAGSVSPEMGNSESPSSERSSPLETGAPIEPDKRSDKCSSRGAPGALPGQALPEAVAETRAEIAQAAWACNYRSLGELALQGSDWFVYQAALREPGPGPFWQRADRCELSLNYMISVLSVPFVVEETSEELLQAGFGEELYKWPSATSGSATSDDWQAIRRVFPGNKKLVNRWQEQGDYRGFEVWISSNGDWVLFDDYSVPFDRRCPRR